MTSLTVPSVPSTTLPAQHPIEAGFAEAAPWRRILAVEPDSAVLNAKSLLLTQANYCVTQATCDRDLFLLRGTPAIALAILSDRLGQRLLRTVAETVRRQWPRARILILGLVPRAMEDTLYDEHICRSPDPEQVLADLDRLYQGMWNPRSNTLDWNAAKSVRRLARQPIPESDPTKMIQLVTTEGRSLGDRPSDIRNSVTRAS
jgi:hypothetical protein